MKMEPAYTIIKLMGGPKAVAGIVGKHASRIYRWTYPESAREGTGGLIPTKDAMALLNHARSVGIDLQASDFFDPARLLARSQSEEAQP